MKEDQALLAIQKLMDGKEWDSDTTSVIAGIIEAAGYPVRDPNDVVEEAESWCPSSVWSEHSKWPASSWATEVENNDTRLGYVDWVNNQIKLGLSADEARTHILKLDDAEHATVLAALRFYQQNRQGNPAYRSNGIHDIATNCGTVISLDDEAIDELCERINC